MARFMGALFADTQLPVRSDKVFSSYAKCYIVAREITYKSHTVKHRP